MTTTRKMEVGVRTLCKQEMDVTFPVYSEHDVTCDGATESYILYSRVDIDVPAEGKMSKVTIGIMGDREVTLEIDNDFLFDNSELDYHLGRGYYKSSKEAFNQALEKLKALAAGVGEGAL